MIGRLQRELAEVDQLSLEEQEELALFIEASRQAHGTLAPAQPPAQPWQDPAGAWSDLPEDDEAATFYRMRHETAPSAFNPAP